MRYRYRYDREGWTSYRYKPIKLPPEAEEKLRRWREESDAKLRAEFPEQFERLYGRKKT